MCFLALHETYRTGGLRKLTAELVKARLDVVAIQNSGYDKDVQYTHFRGYNQRVVRKLPLVSLTNAGIFKVPF